MPSATDRLEAGVTFYELFIKHLPGFYKNFYNIFNVG